MNIINKLKNLTYYRLKDKRAINEIRSLWYSASGYTYVVSCLLRFDVQKTIVDGKEVYTFDKDNYDRLIENITKANDDNDKMIKPFSRL